MKKLDDKVIIVSGATSGIGRAIAELFVYEGARVVLSGRNEEAGSSIVEAFGKKNTLFVAGDIRFPQTNEMLVSKAVKTFGKIDCIVANAGTLGLGKVVELSFEKWAETIDTNLNAAFYLAHYAIPYLMKSRNASMIGISSIAAFKSFPAHPAYCVSKAGLIALFRQIAVDYSPEVRANIICPGPVDTPLIWDSSKAFDNPESAVQNAGLNTLMKRLGKPGDIAKMVLFLASDDASWITGSVFNIDGGATVK